MTFIDENTSREDLEVAIINENNLYRSLNEHRFLNEGYTTDELRQIITAWVLAGDECASL